MAIDKNLFIDNFLTEADENLGAIEASILVLKRDPEKKEEFVDLMRSLHTLKGSARMLKFQTVETIAHGLETVLKGVKDGRYPIHANLILLVFAACNLAREALARVRATKDDTIDLGELLDAYRKAQANEPFTLEWAHRGEAGGGDAAAGESPGKAGKTGEPPRDAAPPADAAPDSIRVRTSRLDSILEMHSDLIINQFQLKKEKEYFVNMERLCRELIADDGRTGTANLRYELLAQVVNARTHFNEQMELVERSALEVQKELLSLHMLPVSLVLGMLPKMVEETAQGLGKDIRVDIVGESLGLDRLILDHLRDPLIHIVRNSVDHGIETPDERERAGKLRTGTIRIACALESGSCVIRVSDDGRGFDYERIRSKAVAMNLYRGEEAERLDESSLNALLFTSGFSTRDEASALSGRGVGLDIVRHEIESVKGKITVRSEAGKGVEFTLTLPLSLATVKGFFVTVGGQRYLIPSQYIEEILMYRRENEMTVMNRRSILIRDKVVPVYYLGILFGGVESAESAEYHVVVVEYLGDLIGIIVDEVQQYASLIYKPLPPALSALKPVQGFVYDENFDMVHVLVVPELIQRFRRSRNIDSKKRFSAARAEYRRVLVVDDSFSTREIEKSILALEGYKIETAVDGIEALEILRRQHFDLIVTDINMPRMDGATLIENLRRDEKYRAVPILVVSSESDGEKRQRLMSLGANGYILKADFDRGNLAGEARYLLSQAPDAGRREGN